MRKTAVILTALGILAAAACGCGAPAEQEVKTLRLCEVTHSVFYAPQYVALSQGFFEEEGLAIELSNGGGADKVMTAVLTGQADIGLAGPEACIYVHHHPPKCTQNKEHGLQKRAHTQTYATDFAVRVDTVNRNSALPKIFQGKFRNRIDRVGLCRTYRSRLASHNGDFALSEVSIHASRVGGDCKNL